MDMFLHMCLHMHVFAHGWCYVLDSIIIPSNSLRQGCLIKSRAHWWSWSWWPAYSAAALSISAAVVSICAAVLSLQLFYLSLQLFYLSLQLFYLSLPVQARITVRPPHPLIMQLGFWRSELWSSCLCDKCSNHWTSSLAPQLKNFNLALENYMGFIQEQGIHCKCSSVNSKLH